MGLSNKFDPDDQLDQVALYWLNVCKAEPAALDDPRAGQGSRRPARHRRRQPHPQARRPRQSRRPRSWPSSGRAGTGSKSCSWPTTAARSSVDFLDTVLSFLDPAIAVTLIDIAEGRPGPGSAGPGPCPGRGRGAGGHSAGRRTGARARPRGRLPGGPGRARPAHRADRAGKGSTTRSSSASAAITGGATPWSPPTPPATCSSTLPAA